MPVAPDVTRDTPMDWTARKVRFGIIVYTDRFRSYGGLMTFKYKHLRTGHGERLSEGPVFLNGLEEFRVSPRSGL